MALAARLRLVMPDEPWPTESAAPYPLPELRSMVAADRPAPDLGGPHHRRRFRPFFLASLLLHIGAAAALLAWAETGEERAAGGTDEFIILEGASVELLDSMPSVLVQATMIESTEAAPEITDDAPLAETATTAAIADAVPKAEALSSTVQSPAADAAVVAPLDDATKLASEPAQPASLAHEPVAPDTRPLLPSDVTAEIIPDSVAPLDAGSKALAAAADKPLLPADDRPLKVAEVEPVIEPAPQVKPAKPREVSPAKAAPSRPAPASVARKAARGPQKGSGGAGGSSKDNIGKASASSYRSRLVAHLRRYQTYPAAAAGKRLTGTVTVTFTLSGGGNVTSARVSGSSGHGVLDSAALGAVRRASPFPAIPAGLGSSITISAPIRFAR